MSDPASPDNRGKRAMLIDPNRYDPTLDAKLALLADVHCRLTQDISAFTENFQHALCELGRTFETGFQGLGSAQAAQATIQAMQNSTMVAASGPPPTDTSDHTARVRTLEAALRRMVALHPQTSASLPPNLLPPPYDSPNDQPAGYRSLRLYVYVRFPFALLPFRSLHWPMATVRTVPLTGFVCHSPSVIFAVSLAGRLELDMRLSPHT